MPLTSYRLNLQHEGCVLIREGLVRCAVRPLWSPRLLISFVPWKAGDTVTARGRKELSVVKPAGNTCFTHPSRGPWRIEERQLVGLTGNAMVTVSTAALMTTQAKRLATTGCMKSVCIAGGIWLVLYLCVRLWCQMSSLFVCFLIRALYSELSHFTGDDNMECWVNKTQTTAEGEQTSVEVRGTAAFSPR